MPYNLERTEYSASFCTKSPRAMRRDHFCPFAFLLTSSPKFVILVWDRILTTPTVVFLLKFVEESPTYFFTPGIFFFKL